MWFRYREGNVICSERDRLEAYCEILVLKRFFNQNTSVQFKTKSAFTHGLTTVFGEQNKTKQNVIV